jgi:hypothetical protein
MRCVTALSELTFFVAATGSSSKEAKEAREAKAAFVQDAKTDMYLQR